MIRSIIFNVDDTLFLTEDKFINNLLLTAQKLNLQRVSKKKIYRYYHFLIEKMIAKIWNKANIQQFLKTYVAHSHKTPYPLVKGAKEVLCTLKKKRYLLGILTGRRRQSLRRRARQSGLSLRMFRYIYTGDDTVITKPNPKVFSGLIAALNKKGIANKEILYVGDSVTDAQASLKNRIGFVGVLTGKTTKQQFVHSKVPSHNILLSVAQLPSWLAKYGNI